MDQAHAHLPEEPNRFIGREREIAELRRVLRQARALTLCGPGGIGKTRLALRILAAAAAEFPDGTFLVELADLRRADLGQADLVVSRVAAAIGVSEEAGRPLADTLADALRPRRLGLALDNCEHLIEACAAARGPGPNATWLRRGAWATPRWPGCGPAGSLAAARTRWRWPWRRNRPGVRARR